MSSWTCSSRFVKLISVFLLCGKRRVSKVYICPGLSHRPGTETCDSRRRGTDHQVRERDLWREILVNEHRVWWVVVLFRGWLERESRHGLQPGQNWFLISMQWWQQWKDYVKYVGNREKKQRFTELLAGLRHANETEMTKWRCLLSLSRFKSALKSQVLVDLHVMKTVNL